MEKIYKVITNMKNYIRGEIMFQDLKIKEFIAETASKSPAPGGGSVAAVTAALAAALSSMVFNISIGKKAYLELSEEIQGQMNEALKWSEVAINEFIDLMEMDATVFLSLMDAYKLPKATEEECRDRKIKIEEASEKALNVPRQLAEKAFRLYDTIEIGASFGNINVISDAGVAAVLIHGAIESSVINIKINLNSVKDEQTKQQINQQCQRLISESLERKNSILGIMNNKI
jgi:formiminotetrahydrofolate cyclodeaminase